MIQSVSLNFSFSTATVAELWSTVYIGTISACSSIQVILKTQFRIADFLLPTSPEFLTVCTEMRRGSFLEMVRISFHESHFNSSNWSRLPESFSLLVNFPNNVCGSFTAIATTRFFGRQGRYDFACCHCTFRSRKGKFTNRMQAFLTPTSLILASYVPAECKPSNIEDKNNCSRLISFQHSIYNAILFLSFCTLLLRQHKKRGIYFSKHPGYNPPPQIPQEAHSTNELQKNTLCSTQNTFHIPWMRKEKWRYDSTHS